MRRTLAYVLGLIAFLMLANTAQATCYLNNDRTRPDYVYADLPAVEAMLRSRMTGNDNFDWYPPSTQYFANGTGASYWTIHGVNLYNVVCEASPAGTVLDTGYMPCLTGPEASGISPDPNVDNMTAAQAKQCLTNLGYPPYGTVCDKGNEATFKTPDGVAPADDLYQQVTGGSVSVYMKGSYVSTGKLCTSQPKARASTPSMPIFSCGANQTSGQVNGKNVCLSSSSGNEINPVTGKEANNQTTSSTSETTKTNSDNSTTKTTTTTTQNPDASVTTTTTACTTPSGGGSASCTTTRSTVGQCATSSGCDGKSGDTDNAKFCQDNPNSPICKEHKFTPTACGTAPSCEGDAIMCGIAAEQYKRNCAMFDDKTDLSRKGEAYANGTDTSGTDPFTSNGTSPIDISGKIDQTETYAASCPPDPTFTVYGNTYSIPLDNLCKLGKILGYLNVSSALILAVLIVSGAKR